MVDLTVCLATSATHTACHTPYRIYKKDRAAFQTIRVQRIRGLRERHSEMVKIDAERHQDTLVW